MIYEDIMSRTRLAGTCWEWTGAKLASGYGSVRFEGRTRVAHHVTWERQHGPIPAGMDLDHLCRNRACVNPDHLEAVTRSENLRRGAGGFGLNGRCRSGAHSIEEVGVYVSPVGGRGCRACRKARRAAYRERTGR